MPSLRGVTLDFPDSRTTLFQLFINYRVDGVLYQLINVILCSNGEKRALTRVVLIGHRSTDSGVPLGLSGVTLRKLTSLPLLKLPHLQKNCAVTVLQNGDHGWTP